MRQYYFPRGEWRTRAASRAMLDELLDTQTKHLYISQIASQNIGALRNSGQESSRCCSNPSDKCHG